LSFVKENPDCMVTFGIRPTYPSTQLGYIKCASAGKYHNAENTICPVEAFREKPGERTAKEYLNDSRYLWNSGMFVWKAKTILADLKKFLPETTEPLGNIQRGWDTPNQKQILEEWFLKLPKISIDYAVMEKADKIYAIKMDCRWLDMGSFAALADIITSDEDNNIVVAGASELLDCKNSIIVTEDHGHLIAAIGLEDMVVAHSPDATLVCHIDQTQKLKDLLELIKRHAGDKFL
jgi:mannose-1-phosphate guanylyltransferase